MIICKSRKRNIGYGWPLSFLFFGLMNVDGFFLHCFNHPNKMSVARRSLHCLDIMFTALSSANMFVGTLEFLHVRISNLTVALVCICLMEASIMGAYFRTPFWAELLYIGITAVAAAFAGWVLVIWPLLQVSFGSVFFFSTVLFWKYWCSGSLFHLYEWISRTISRSCRCLALHCLTTPGSIHVPVCSCSLGKPLHDIAIRVFWMWCGVCGTWMVFGGAAEAMETKNTAKDWLMCELKK